MSVFIPSPITKNIHSELSSFEIHRKLNILPHSPFQGKPQVFTTDNFTKYYKNDENDFTIENNFRFSKAGIFTLIGTGTIITSGEHTEITIIYKIGKSFIGLLTPIFFVIISLGWCYCLYTFYDMYGYWNYKTMLMLIGVIYLSIFPSLHRFIIKKHIENFHRIVLHVLNT